MKSPRATAAQANLDKWQSTALWKQGRIFGNILNAPEPKDQSELVHTALVAIYVDAVTEHLNQESVLYRMIREGR